MRKENSIKNIKSNIIFFVVNSVLIFVSKTILIKYLGAEYTGLQSVLTNLINYMNIAELGITTAITYSLYKPLKENDFKKINSNLIFFKEMYKIIGIVIAIITVFMGIFINKIVKSDFISQKEILLYFSIYALKTIISYFLTYLQILMVADQKNYIITRISGFMNIAKVLIQIVFVILFKNFFIWVLLEFIFEVSYYIIMNRVIRAKYNWITLKKRNTTLKELIEQNESIFADTKNLVVHKISNIVVFQTDNIVLSYFSNLTMVAKYTNYVMITNLLSSFVSQIFTGIKASLGNLIAEGDNLKVFKFWEEINYIVSMMGLVMCYCFYVNVNNLITIWLDKNYLLNKSIILVIAMNLFFQVIRNMTDTFKEGYGIFWDRKAAIAEAIINLILSILLVNIYGVIGVVIGTLVSNIIIVAIWKPYVTFKYGFKVSFQKYSNSLIYNIIIFIISIIISEYVLKVTAINFSSNIALFIYQALISFLSIITILSVISLLYKPYRSLYLKYFKIILGVVRKSK